MELTKVSLQHIQIYPGDVLQNMQDLFMSVSISASHLETESAASTPQHSLSVTYIQDTAIKFKELHPPFNPDNVAKLHHKRGFPSPTLKETMRNDQLKLSMTE